MIADHGEKFVAKYTLRTFLYFPGNDVFLSKHCIAWPNYHPTRPPDCRKHNVQHLNWTRLSKISWFVTIWGDPIRLFTETEGLRQIIVPWDTPWQITLFFENPNSSRTRSNCSLSIVLILVSSRGISHFSTTPNCNSYTIHYSLTELRSTIREDIFSVALVYDSRTWFRSIREGPRPATSQSAQHVVMKIGRDD